MLPSDCLLISVKPQYADLILTGEKEVELRRSKPRVAIGSAVLIYATSPSCSLHGLCQVEEVVQEKPSELWDRWGALTGVSLQTFRAYFEGVDRAVGIRLGAAQLLARPIPLSDLRDRLSGFHPPRSFRYLLREQVNTLCDSPIVT